MQRPPCRHQALEVTVKLQLGAQTAELLHLSAEAPVSHSVEEQPPAAPQPATDEQSLARHVDEEPHQ